MSIRCSGFVIIFFCVCELIGDMVSEVYESFVYSICLAYGGWGLFIQLDSILLLLLFSFASPYSGELLIIVCVCERDVYSKLVCILCVWQTCICE